MAYLSDFQVIPYTTYNMNFLTAPIMREFSKGLEFILALKVNSQE